MDNRPHLPRTLAGSQEVVLDLVANGIQGISIHKTEVGEEDTHKDGAPNDLIHSHLGKNGDGIGAWNLLIEPIVEVMARGTVVNESKEGEGGETLPLNGSTGDEYLSEQISEEPTDEGGHGLGGDGVLVEGFRVGIQSGDGTAACDGGITEQGAVDRMLLTQGRLANEGGFGEALGLGDDGGDAKGLSREAG